MKFQIESRCLSQAAGVIDSDNPITKRLCSLVRFKLVKECLNLQVDPRQNEENPGLATNAGQPVGAANLPDLTHPQ